MDCVILFCHFTNRTHCSTNSCMTAMKTWPVDTPVAGAIRTSLQALMAHSHFKFGLIGKIKFECSDAFLLAESGNVLNTPTQPG